MRARIDSFTVALTLGFALGCGGRAHVDESGDTASSRAGTAGADSSAGPSIEVTPSVAGMGAMAGMGAAGAAGTKSGAAVADADSDLSNGCPQAVSNTSCSAAEIDISLTREAVGPSAGVWVEPLQIPEYVPVRPEDVSEVEPSHWDRSALPAGACVLRIHGLAGACLRPNKLLFGTCASVAAPDSPQVVPNSFYETGSCGQGIAPGCPSAAASDSRNGNWWYLVARGDDTDFVSCAPQCNSFALYHQHVCLRMAGSN